jgi:hypothetical protein
MAIKVNPMARIVERCQAGAQQGSADYAANAIAAAGDYGTRTAASGAAWKAGVNGPGTDTRFMANVRGKGQAKYSRKISAVGASRFAEGVANGGQEYQAGFAPYADLLRGLTPPGRGPRGSPANKAIAAFVSDALHARRVGLTAAGR